MNFTVYSKDGCPYCTKVVQVLELAKLRHVVYKLDEHFDKKSFYGQFGQGSTFPQVVVDATNLGGCTDTIQYLKEKKLVLPYKGQGKTEGGLFLPNTVVEEQQVSTQVGYVLKVGDLAYKDEKKFPTGPWCAEKDWVMFARYSGARICVLNVFRLFTSV